MADTRQIKVEALWDGTRLEAGTETSQRSLDDLRRAVDDTSDDINRSLRSIDDGVSSTLGSGGSFDRAVDDVETSGRRMKDIGSEVGSEFSENIGEGIRSGDIGGSILETFTSLGPGLGVLGIAIAAGAGIINGLISGARDRQKALDETFNEVFSGLEITAKTTLANIRKQLFATFDINRVLEDIGGEAGLAGGFRTVNDLARQTGVAFNDIVDLLRGNITPATEATRKALEGYAAETRTASDGLGHVSQIHNELADSARDLLAYTEDTRGQIQEQVPYARQYRDYLRQSADAGRDVRGQAEGVATANERAAAAAQRMADAYRTAAQQRLPDNLW